MSSGSEALLPSGISLGEEHFSWRFSYLNAQTREEEVGTIGTIFASRDPVSLITKDEPVLSIPSSLSDIAVAHFHVEPTVDFDEGSRSDFYCRANVVAILQCFESRFWIQLDVLHAAFRSLVRDKRVFSLYVMDMLPCVILKVSHTCFVVCKAAVHYFGNFIVMAIEEERRSIASQTFCRLPTVDDRKTLLSCCKTSFEENLILLTLMTCSCGPSSPVFEGVSEPRLRRISDAMHLLGCSSPADAVAQLTVNGGPGRLRFCDRNPHIISFISAMYEQSGATIDPRLRKDQFFTHNTLSYRRMAQLIADAFNVQIKESLFHSLHLPRVLTSHQARRHASVIRVRMAKPTKDEVKKHADAHFTSANVAFYKIMCHAIESARTLACDDAAKLPTNVAPRDRLIQTPTGVVFFDEHSGAMTTEGRYTSWRLPTTDFGGVSGMSIVLSGILLLQVDTVSNRKRVEESRKANSALYGHPAECLSLNGGKSFYVVRAHGIHPSNHFRHLDEILFIISKHPDLFWSKSRNAFLSMLNIISDGGCDWTPRTPRARLFQAFLFSVLDLDTLIHQTHQGGGSKGSPAERPHTSIIGPLSAGGVVACPSEDHLPQAVSDVVNRLRDVTFSKQPISVYDWNVVCTSEYIFVPPQLLQYCSGGLSAKERKNLRKQRLMPSAALTRLQATLGIRISASFCIEDLENLEARHCVYGRYFSGWFRNLKSAPNATRFRGIPLHVYDPMDVPCALPDPDRHGHYLSPDRSLLMNVESFLEHAANRTGLRFDRVLSPKVRSSTSPMEFFRPSRLIGEFLVCTLEPYFFKRQAHREALANDVSAIAFLCCMSMDVLAFHVEEAVRKKDRNKRSSH